jgi:hypothetical protein
MTTKNRKLIDKAMIYQKINPGQRGERHFPVYQTMKSIKTY